MRTPTVTFILLLSAFLLLATGCSQYEFGPGFSLRTKKGRISNEWKIEEAFINGQPDTANVLPRFEVDINRDESFIFYDTLMNSEGNDSVVTFDGSWSFLENGEEVILVSEEQDSTRVYLWHILRLAGDEFWFEEKDNSTDVYEYHMVPK